MRRLKRSFFPWMLHHALEFWHYYIGALLSLFLLHWIQSQLPLMAKDLGDFVMNSKIEQIPLKEFILMAIGIVVFRTLSRLLFFYPARIQQKTLRIELLEELEEAPPERWSGWSSGQIYQVLFNDINRLRSLIGFGLLQVGNIIIALSVFIPKIEEFHPSFLIALLPMVLSVGIFSLIIYLFQPMVKKTMDYQGEVQNFFLWFFIFGDGADCLSFLDWSCCESILRLLEENKGIACKAR